MEKYNVAYGESRQSKTWHNSTITEEELISRLRTTFRTSETVSEYAAMKGAARSNVKDKGGFVAGFLKNGQRKASTVESRSMLTLDVDNAALSFLEEYSALCPYRSLIYSTHSHTSQAPRFRLVVFLSRNITPDEYQAISRYYAAEWNIAQFDPCSFIPSQLMFWPTTPSDGEYIFEEVGSDILDPDAFLLQYPDWKDPTNLPISPKEKSLRETNSEKKEDPLKKDGIVGTFCRAYFPIDLALDNFLSDIYEKVGENRYRLRSSSSVAGAMIYDGKYLYSNHATDVAYHQLCNAFDIVRIHLFGDDDTKKSFIAMCEFATKQPEVSRLLLEEKQASALQDFATPQNGEDDNAEWKNSFQRDKHGNLINNLYNLGLIMMHDPFMKSIVFNELADGMEIKGDVSWKHGERKFWRDADDKQLIWYVDQNYGSFSQRNYDIAVTKCVDDRSYHPIKEYLSSLPSWDGIPRVDTLLIDYLGAADNDYVRAISRKTLCAAVTRIYHPGTKFDTMLVLNGPQGIGKSTLISKLGMEWFSDSLTLSDMNDGKTAPEKLQGYWIHEIGEMAGMKKADIDKVKSFVSRQDDKYRAAFGRRVTPHPRQCIFFGTTNAENGFLRDVTGNRRYWVVTTPGDGIHKPWELTQDDVDQIWAEVLILVGNGEKLYLDPNLEEHAKREQSAAMESDEREGIVRLYLEMPLPANWSKMDIYQRREYVRGEDPTMAKGTEMRKTVSNMEIWCECFGRAKEDMKPSDSYQIKSIMSRIEGWERADKLTNLPLYGRQRVYRRATS